MSAAYASASGLLGKLSRIRARVLARAPARVRSEARLVSFTFDDFPKSAAETGAQMLERVGARGTFYAATGLMGGDGLHGALYDADDIARLSAAGHEIAEHSCDHVDYARMTSASIEADLDASANRRSQLGLAAHATAFAYPYGEASPAAKHLIASRFATARGIGAGVNRGLCDRALLRATPIENLKRTVIDTVIEDFDRHGGWLIFYIHDVCDHPSKWGCTPDLLEQTIERARAVGGQLTPVSTAALDAFAS